MKNVQTINTIFDTFTVRQAAGLLNVSVSMIYKLIHTGQLRHIRINGAYRIPIPEIERVARGGLRKMCESEQVFQEA